MVGQRGGEGVDAFGGPVVDPTKNVLDLVKAESIRQDGLRDAETRRIDQLADLRAQYESKIESIQAANLERTSMLLAQQVREVKAELADRMSKMEQFRWESGAWRGGQSQLISWAIAAAAVTFSIIMYVNKP